ncbi:hypothetical protein [Saccharothrix longispora]|uniref:hypothetical protein n=1 Tax=Saccharothrix longispora TaxID=33920 RepID=UPI0028FDAC5F|nr:hypothetical protein [Saccharothrix longispora]MDU0294843.1 hypothetical protein [Saccharothrix longispora]
MAGIDDWYANRAHLHDLDPQYDQGNDEQPDPFAFGEVGETPWDSVYAKPRDDRSARARPGGKKARVRRTEPWEVLARERAARERISQDQSLRESADDRADDVRENVRPVLPEATPEVTPEGTSESVGAGVPIDIGESRNNGPSSSGSAKRVGFLARLVKRLLGRGTRRPGWFARRFGPSEPVMSPKREKPPASAKRAKRDKQPKQPRQLEVGKRRPKPGKRGKAASGPDHEPRLRLSVPRVDEFRPAVVRCNACEMVVTQDGRCRCG